MAGKSGDNPTGFFDSVPPLPVADDLANDGPPQQEWHLMSEDRGEARRALFAARMQLD